VQLLQQRGLSQGSGTLQCGDRIFHLKNETRG
jgi:hypothetical protein